MERAPIIHQAEWAQTIRIPIAELARLRADAERWRWIRRQPWLYWTTEAVDAAIAAEKAT